MKISELVKILEGVKFAHGDIEVKISTDDPVCYDISETQILLRNFETFSEVFVLTKKS